MAWLSEGISFALHPIFMPLYTVLLYFYVSPRYFLPQNINSLTSYLLTISVIVPLLFLLALVFTKVVQSYRLNTPRERLFFSVIMTTVYFIIFVKLMAFHDYLELLPFFFGIFLSLMMLVVLNYKKIKPSMHSMAISGALSFFLMWSYYSKVNILLFIALIIMLTSMAIAARLFLKAHTSREIVIGLIIGVLMQIISFYFILEFF